MANDQPKKHLLFDPSLWFLLFSNIIIIFIASKENWNLVSILWIYWLQSVIIGLFHFIRMLQTEENSLEKFEFNGRSVQPTQVTVLLLAFFFLFHYGFFHFVYLIFLLAGTFTKQYGSNLDLVEFKFILLAALLFLVNHLFSFFYNKPKEVKKQNINLLMYYPYLRIIPMHLVIIFSPIITSALPLFLVLKTFADGIMHIMKHKALRKDKGYQV